MTERYTPGPVMPEVLFMQQWIEQEVIQKGTCPPLIKLAQQHRDDQGRINWGELSQEVDIVSYRHLPASSETLVQTAAVNFVDFIAQATLGRNVPLTRLYVLPDFKTNPDYDQFMDSMKKTALFSLLTSSDGQPIIRLAYQQGAEAQGIAKDDIEAAQRGGVEALVQMGIQVVEGLFNPVFFYGRAVTDQDIADMSDARGPRERQKMLSRAPYYSMQVINILKSGELTGELNRPRLHAHNTRIALTTNLSAYENTMNRLRNG